MNSRNQFFFQRRTLLSAALGAAAFSAIGTPLTVFAAAESDPAQQLDRIKKPASSASARKAYLCLTAITMNKVA